MFQLTAEEWAGNSSQIVMTSNRPKSAPPFAFTEQGVAMLSGLLKSDVAIAANIAIMRAFVQVREYLMVASSVIHRPDRASIILFSVLSPGWSGRP